MRIKKDLTDRFDSILETSTSKAAPIENVTSTERSSFEIPNLKGAIRKQSREAQPELPSEKYLKGYTWIPAAQFGASFRVMPNMVVVHRGAYARGVAEYFHAPQDNRIVSAHFAWSAHENKMVQCVHLTRIAHHAGGGVWNGDRWINSHSIGIELPGPISAPFKKGDLESFRQLMVDLKAALPSLSLVVGHSDIDPKGRTDPGSYFNWSIFDGLGFEGPHIS